MDPFKMCLQGRADVRSGLSSLLWGVCVRVRVRVCARVHIRALGPSSLLKCGVCPGRLRSLVRLLVCVWM